VKIETYEKIMGNIATFLFFSPIIIPILLGIFIDKKYFVLIITFLMGTGLAFSWGFGFISDVVAAKIYKDKYYERQRDKIYCIFGDL
jgi:hypothetical protein